MRRYLSICLALLIIAISGGIALASVITGATWRGNIQVSNNSTSPATNVSTICSINITAMVANGYMDDYDDAVITDGAADIPFMPGHGSNPWVIFVDSIGAAVEARRCAQVLHAVYTIPQKRALA